MNTLQEHIDDLDRMADGRADIPKIRNQIAFIGREVTAFEAEYARLADAHTKLQEAHTALQNEKAHPDSEPPFLGWQNPGSQRGEGG